MSAIAANASISLLTAPPGSGKSLRAVWYLKNAVEAGEQVFACNINGLNIDGVTDFPDPTQWEQLPPKSVLVVDEAQNFFRAGAGAVPDYIKAMETIRHGGIRLILMTQHPALIHTNIRALVGYHEHLVRENGKESAIIYSRSRVIDNVRSDKALAVEDHHTWAYPKECYALYKSAEVHTVKRTIPHKYKRAAVMALVAVALFAFVGYTVYGSFKTEGDGKDALTAPATARASGFDQRPDENKPKWNSAADYATAHLPRFGTMPWTAPVFDHRSASADPQLLCMSTDAGVDANGDRQDASCTCLTEQGTKYDLGDGECRRIARDGPVYNPYKDRRSGSYASTGAQGEGREPDRRSAYQAPPSAPGQAGQAAPGPVLSAPQVARYGQIGVGGSAAATPPE
ncbi:zonular occludens toxin domain-containing protein [Lysobacter sp. 1R34A]|uniref:zonular occludens toxin domain-containing protein n=1 Tax=Lysobacter sp. 1R34A TaxID=3445786 RepID=UPI003EEBB3CA